MQARTGLITDPKQCSKRSMCSSHMQTPLQSMRRVPHLWPPHQAKCWQSHLSVQVVKTTSKAKPITRVLAQIYASPTQISFLLVEILEEVPQQRWTRTKRGVGQRGAYIQKSMMQLTHTSLQAQMRLFAEASAVVTLQHLR